MTRHAVGVIALVALALSAEPAAAATVAVTTTQRAVVFSRDRGFPRVGATAVELGFETSVPGPATPAVSVGRTTITGHPSRHVWTYRGTAESYSETGVLRSVLTGRMRFRGKRRIDSGRGHVVGGTGGFSGVTGTFTFTADNRVGARVATYVTRGTYSFPEP